MAKQPSRSDRWSAAVNAEREAHSALDAAFTDLLDLQSEYEDWRDGLPESGGSDATREKLDAVCDLDLSTALEDVDSVIDECDSVELPQGFGRD